MIEKIKELMNENIETKNTFLAKAPEILAVTEKIIEAYQKGNKVLVFGNGGSAADAQHIATELVCTFLKKRRALSAIALTTDTSTLTAWSNDVDFNEVFSRQVEAHAKPGDILWGISTSGNSGNVVKALEKGKEIGTINISLTGNNGGKIKELSDFNINVESNSTPRIQECHILAYHIICELVEKELSE